MMRLVRYLVIVLGVVVIQWLALTVDLSATGLLNTQVDHSSGGSLTSTYSYGTTQPHTLAKVAQSGTGASPERNFGYDARGVLAETIAACAAANVVGRSAESVANAAFKAGRTTGAAAELKAAGKMFTDVSTGGAARQLHPDVNAALDRVPIK